MYKFLKTNLFIGERLEGNIFSGTYKGVPTRVKLDEKNDKIYLERYCVQCGNAFWDALGNRRPKTYCEHCRKNMGRKLKVVGEKVINGKVFLVYSNKSIYPKIEAKVEDLTAQPANQPAAQPVSQ